MTTADSRIPAGPAASVPSAKPTARLSRLSASPLISSREVRLRVPGTVRSRRSPRADLGPRRLTVAVAAADARAGNRGAASGRVRRPRARSCQRRSGTPRLPSGSRRRGWPSAGWPTARPTIGMPASNAPKTTPIATGCSRRSQTRRSRSLRPSWTARPSGEEEKRKQRDRSARFDDLERLGEPALGQARIGRATPQPAAKTVLEPVHVPGLALVRAQRGDLAVRTCPSRRHSGRAKVPQSARPRAPSRRRVLHPRAARGKRTGCARPGTTASSAAAPTARWSGWLCRAARSSARASGTSAGPAGPA